ncbi:DUF1311 domain-containing protein [Lentibacillus lipolyticus]|nr:DUF1311 domain-containing protein [Lentibacillus lipolyticus]
MKSSRKFLMVMLTVVLVLLAACDNSAEKSSAKSDNQSPDSNLTEGADDNKSNQEMEDAQGDTDDTRINNPEDTSKNTSADSNDGVSLNSSASDSEVAGTKKEKYLEKLNEMEESDRYAEAGSTMPELEKQEAERYKNWDEALNEIYGELEEQLSTEQMDTLREEQRNWVEHRDEAAKEASLEYEGGSTESLEYVATQASLTRDRCYALVAKYMN